MAVATVALAAAANGSGPFESFFGRGFDVNDDLFPKAEFGRFGVSKNRAEILLRSMHLSDGPEQPAGAGVHWFLDSVLADYNSHIAKAFKPSWLGCIDESGPPWHGVEGEG